MITRLATTLLLSVFLLPVLSATAGRPEIDTQRSLMTIRVFKAGLLSAFGHEHEISAPIQQGSFTEDKPTVELQVDARKLRVMDQGVSDKDRAEIQTTMLGPTVLDSETFPQIGFHSTEID